ncbi:MAG: GGDEF domain-containing protein [Thermoanaerobaculia bacterium]|nr:GGDEF domain-containing protein [Thermoanaerobaculia bacterium]
MIRRLLAPVFLLLAVLALDVYLTSRVGVSWRQDPRLLQALRVLVALVFALAWRLRRGRLAWVTAAAWLVAESLRSLGSYGGAPLEQALVVGLAAAVLLPLHLAAAAWLGEWWVASRAGLVRFGVLAAEVGLLAFLVVSARGWQMVADALQGVRLGIEARWPRWVLPGLIGNDATLDAYALPVLRLGSFVLAAVAVAWALRIRRTPVEAGLLGALVAIFPATLRADLTLVCFGAAVLVLGVALVENAVRLAFDDGLTGLPARRALEESLAQIGGSYSLAMVDIDHFKKLNDRHGHEVGDQVLRKVAARLAKVRGGRAFRYGGEEFTLVFPGKIAVEAETAVELVRQAVAGEPFTVRSPGRPKKPQKGRAKRGSGGSDKRLKVTVSAGVADRNERRSSPEEVLQAADKALYKAKKAGRNRVAVAK